MAPPVDRQRPEGALKRAVARIEQRVRAAPARQEQQHRLPAAAVVDAMPLDVSPKSKPPCPRHTRPLVSRGERYQQAQLDVVHAGWSWLARRERGARRRPCWSPRPTAEASHNGPPTFDRQPSQYAGLATLGSERSALRVPPRTARRPG